MFYVRILCLELKPCIGHKYPDEIEAIIGLDMAVPEYYENMKINLALMKLGQYAADLGITRLIPTLAESDAIKHGTLTNDEKNRYRAIFITERQL